MRKYRNTKIVKSILLGLPVLFCSCYNNDSIKNGHCEDEKDFRYENGVVKIYNQPGEEGKLLKTVTVKEEENVTFTLDLILQRCNNILNTYSFTQQQVILNAFDTTKVYTTASEFAMEFCNARVRNLNEILKKKQERWDELELHLGLMLDGFTTFFTNEFYECLKLLNNWDKKKLRYYCSLLNTPDLCDGLGNSDNWKELYK